MRCNKGLGRAEARKRRLAKESSKTPRNNRFDSPYWTRLEWKFKLDPNFRKGKGRKILLKSEVDAALGDKKVTGRQRRKLVKRLRAAKESV